jgi:hypothetical protein
MPRGPKGEKRPAEAIGMAMQPFLDERPLATPEAADRQRNKGRSRL